MNSDFANPTRRPLARGLYRSGPWTCTPCCMAPSGASTLRMGQCNVRRYMTRLLEHIQAGRIDGRAIITHRLPLEDAPAAYELFAGKLDGCVKCVLRPAA